MHLSNVKNTLPSVDELNTLFIYDNGKLIRRKTGNECGLNSKGRYIRARINANTIDYVHRIVWKMHTGKDPILHIDHKNGDGRDNRIENLQELPSWENFHKGRINADFEQQDYTYQATTEFEGRTIILGYFRDASHAAECFKHWLSAQ